MCRAVCHDMKAGGLHPVRCWHFCLPSAEHFIFCARLWLVVAHTAMLCLKGAGQSAPCCIEPKNVLHIRGEKTTLYSKNTTFLQVIFPLPIPFQVSLVPDIIQWC